MTQCIVIFILLGWLLFVDWWTGDQLRRTIKRLKEKYSEKEEKQG